MSRITPPGVFAALLIVFLISIYFNAFGHVRATLADSLYGGVQPLADITIVRIDDASIRALGQWPWSRDIEARLLRKVADARVIGLDVSFLEPSDHDAILASTLAAMPHVVLAAELGDGRLHPPIFPSSYGSVNLLGDSDGTTRRVAPGDGTTPFAFAIAAKLGISPPPLSGPTLINFIGPPGKFRSISAREVLEGDASYAGKIVLIGATAPDLHDEHFVPTSAGRAMSGVEIHATILQNALLGTFLRAQGRLGLAALVGLVGLAGMFLLARMRLLHAIPLLLTMLLAYGLASVVLFDRQHVVLDGLFPPVALLTFTGAGAGLRYIEEKRSGQYLRTAFSKYVSRELLAELLANNRQLTLGGEKRVVTVFFSDIRDFTAISERLAPEVLVPLLNEYLTAMTAVILKHQGTVDKFVGDAIMALWNAPMPDRDHAAKACRTAIEQVRTARALQAHWAERGVPALQLGIGINTGAAVVGNMGSEERFDYTAIGDAINLASRIERLTRLYGVSIIISEHTWNLVKDQFLCCKLDRVRVRGRQDPIVLYRLCLDMEPAFVAAFESALDRYFAGAFAAALDGFKTAASIQSDPACAVFVDRCEAYLRDAPVSWDGSVQSADPSEARVPDTHLPGARTRS